MRAVVDIGSNSVKFVVADDQRDVPKILHTGSAVTRLGENLESDLLIKPQALERTRLALSKFQRNFLEFSKGETRPLQCRVFATSAVRDCKNQFEIQAIVKQTLGVDLRILSGLEEARISMEGAAAAGRALFGDDHGIYIEIGGASTQIGVCHPTFAAHSFQAGGVRCHERLALGRNAIDDHRWSTLETDLLKFFDTEALRTLEREIFKTPRKTAMGIGGTLVMACKLAGAIRSSDAGFILDITTLANFNNHLRKLSADERLKMTGMEPGREDIIVTGICILTALLRKFNIQQLGVSGWGLRHGALRLWERLDSTKTLVIC